MPWEKSFELDDATDHAMGVFWLKGYEATSISDLTKAMGINKGSLYNAFGSKKALFDRVMLKYDRENRQNSLKQLATVSDPLQVIDMLFDGLIAETKADADNKGCLLVNTALELPNHADDVKEMVTGALKEFEVFFEKLVLQGQADGKLSDDLNPQDVARSLLALVVGLRVLARGAFDADALSSIRNEAVRLISR